MADRPNKNEYIQRNRILNKMGFNSYIDYMKSRDWLLRKNEVINVYLQCGWDIWCDVCESTNNLQVHHNNYLEMEIPVITEKDSLNYCFLCNECHEKIHKDDEFLVVHQDKIQELVGI